MLYKETFNCIVNDLMVEDLNEENTDLKYRDLSDTYNKLVDTIETYLYITRNKRKKIYMDNPVLPD